MDHIESTQYAPRTLDVLAVIELAGGPITTAQVIQATGLDRSRLSPILTRLVRRGHILKLSRGLYSKR